MASGGNPWTEERREALKVRRERERDKKAEEERRFKNELDNKNLSSEKGSHKAVQGLIDVDLLADGTTEFNPPMWDNMRVAGHYPIENRGRGWIVRDPVAKVGVGSRPDAYNAYEDDPTLAERIEAEISKKELDTGKTLSDEEKENIRNKHLKQGFQIRSSIEEWHRPFGFRFQYNPSMVSETYHTVSSVNIMGMLSDLQASLDPPVLTYTGAGMTLSLQLDRLTDVRLLWDENVSRKYIQSGYAEPMSDDTLDKIKQYGTMWDLEFLFRTVNGEPSTHLWHERETSDMGFFIPYPVIISIGNKKTSRMIRGSITSLDIQHTMFSHGMIPVRTQVMLEITRHSDAWYTNDPNSALENEQYPEYRTENGKPVIPSSWESWTKNEYHTINGKPVIPPDWGDWNSSAGDSLPLHWAGSITSKYYAQRSGGKRHNGVDIGCPVGTPVKSTVYGTVEFSGWNKDGYGYLVKVRDAHTQAIHFFAHLSKRQLLPQGTRVKPGDVLGLSGNSGNSTGPHLHYGVQDPRGYAAPGWAWFDPAKWLR